VGKILYFLEIACKKASSKRWLIELLGCIEHISYLNHDVRSAKVFYRHSEFKRFMKDTLHTSSTEVDLLVVAIDEIVEVTTTESDNWKSM